MGKVMSCQPRPESRRRAITKGTGAWIERNQRVESFRSFARQYPKGRLRIKTRVATVTIFTGVSQYTACQIVRRNCINYKRRNKGPCLRIFQASRTARHGYLCNRNEASGRQKCIFREDIFSAIYDPNTLSSFSAVPARPSVPVTSPFRTLVVWIIVFSSISNRSSIHARPQ